MLVSLLKYHICGLMADVFECYSEMHLVELSLQTRSLCFVALTIKYFKIKTVS